MVLSIARGVGGVKPGTFLVSKMEKNKQIDSIYLYLPPFHYVYFSKMLLLEWLLSFFKRPQKNRCEGRYSVVPPRYGKSTLLKSLGLVPGCSRALKAQDVDHHCGLVSSDSSGSSDSSDSSDHASIRHRWAAAWLFCTGESGWNLIRVVSIVYVHYVYIICI